MKRVFALILALCMACALFACGKKQTEVAPGGDSPTVTPGATDPGSGTAENPGGSTGVPGGAGSTGNAGNGGKQKKKHLDKIKMLGGCGGRI